MVKQFSFIAVFACEIDKEPDDKLILFVCLFFVSFVCLFYVDHFDYLFCWLV